MKLSKATLSLLLASGIVLAGCGDQAEEAEDNTKPDGEVSQADVRETTDDPLEFIDKTKEEMIFIDGANDYIIKSYYASDETDEQSFNIYEEDGFTLRYALVETENISNVESEGSEEVRIYGEIINDTDDTYYFMERMLIKTDDKEVSEVQFGLNGAGAADQKNKFIDYFPLDYENPDSFTFVLADPSFQGDFKDDFEEGYLVEYTDEEYEKYEGNFKGYMKDHLVVEMEFHKED